MTDGRCQLTGSFGKLVRCHLLPKSLTKSPTPGEPRAEGIPGARPIKRFDGWYDTNLVTRDGEDLLERYDDWAIKELRRLKLVWSSWGGSNSLPGGTEAIEPATGAGLRRLETRDPARLRLFFLSLLWRAASTKLPYFHVDVPKPRLEVLRDMVLTGNSSPASMFPILLTQLSTKGAWHNAGPRTEYKEYLTPPRMEPAQVRYYRFYLDGLIVHIDDEETDPIKDRWREYAVGGDRLLNVLTRPYEGSYQQEWIENLIFESLRNHFTHVESIFQRS